MSGTGCNISDLGQAAEEWLAANYLHGTLGIEGGAAGGGGAAAAAAEGTVAVLGMGGSSTQVRKAPSWPRSWANFSLL